MILVCWWQDSDLTSTLVGKFDLPTAHEQGNLQPTQDHKLPGPRHPLLAAIIMAAAGMDAAIGVSAGLLAMSAR